MKKLILTIAFMAFVAINSYSQSVSFVKTDVNYKDEIINGIEHNYIVINTTLKNNSGKKIQRIVFRLYFKDKTYSENDLMAPYYEELVSVDINPMFQNDISVSFKTYQPTNKNLYLYNFFIEKLYFFESQSLK